MTIVVKEDSRNLEWKQSNKGSALLKKMGWSEGEGLGKRKKGEQHALRAVKRTDEMLGIGADKHDPDSTHCHSSSFASVLSSLKQHHASGSSSSSDTDDDDNKKRKKSSKKKKKKPKASLTLARNKVTAGHAQKMRHAKCLQNKSEKDMAAIFGTTPGSHVLSTLIVKNEDDERPRKKKRKKTRETR